MANRRDAQPNQIVSGEFRQYSGIDIVFKERGCVLFESQAAQPSGDLDRHRQSPRSPVEASPPTAISPPDAHQGSPSGRQDSLENTMWTRRLPGCSIALNASGKEAQGR
jgi:hypothetical protein